MQTRVNHIARPLQNRKQKNQKVKKPGLVKHLLEGLFFAPSP